MNKMTAIIVDDEVHGRSTLRCHLEQYCPEVQIVGEADSITVAVAEIAAKAPQVVFLDINLSHQNGFALFEHFPQPAFSTLFVTAYDNYALQAIRQHAFGYLLKPIDIDELITAVQYTMNRLKEQAAASARSVEEGERVRAAFRELMHAKGPEKVSLAVQDGLTYVLPGDIIRCEARGSYTQFYFSNRPAVLTCRALGFYEALLEAYGFIRVHNQHLINPAHVERYQRGRGGIVIMSDHSEVAIAQRRRDDFLAMMDKHGCTG